ncbi:MAG: hypothetical protein QXU61_04110 [Archaeoglobaceae archaeon]
MIKKELIRKSIHFSGLVYLPSYNIFGPEIVLIALLCLTPLVIILEFLRIKKGLFKSISRDYERELPGAYVYFFSSLLILTMLFPKDTVFVAVVNSVIGDGFAGILRIFGKRSLASIGMFISSSLFLLILDLLNFFSIFASLVGTFVERVKRVGKIKIEDNFSVPILTALADSVKYIF